MRIAICEDDKTTREYEKQLIEKWALKTGVSVSVDLYSSAENYIFESEDKIECDLLLLDIEMGKMNGFELAKMIRSRGFSGALIFLTGIPDYAISGYEVGAVRYILKPIKENDFFDVLDLVFADFSRRKKDVFILQTGSDMEKIPFEDIIYIEAQGHYVRLVGEGKVREKQWKCSFGTVSGDFESHGFFCLRRGFLVNLQHVSKITRTECFLDNEEIIPVARNKYVELNQEFIKVMQRGG